MAKLWLTSRLLDLHLKEPLNLELRVSRIFKLSPRKPCIRGQALDEWQGKKRILGSSGQHFSRHKRPYSMRPSIHHSYKFLDLLAKPTNKISDRIYKILLVSSTERLLFSLALNCK